MANPFFKFKRFTVWHDRCAMKVGTDGVLLGAWTNAPQARTILDVGCGTGLIALMLAQRIPAHFDAIDINEAACFQAEENVAHSPFAGRIQVWHSALADFARERAGKVQYDCIVSNPPYFVDSLKCPDSQRNQARHSDTLSLNELIRCCKPLLSPKGFICLVLPFDRRKHLLQLITKASLSLQRETVVYPTPTASPKRLLVQFGMLPCEVPQPMRLVIERERHQLTEEFTALVHDYYLHL